MSERIVNISLSFKYLTNMKVVLGFFFFLSFLEIMYMYYKMHSTFIYKTEARVGAYHSCEFLAHLSTKC